jgi:hypothetical protein
MRCLALLVLTFVAALAVACRQAPAEEYVGALSPELVPAYGAYAVMLRAAAPEELLALPEIPAAGVRVFQGSFGGRFKGMAVAMLEPDAGSAVLFVDTNRNSAFEAAERLPVEPSAERPEFEGVALVRLAADCGPHSELPVELRVMEPRPGMSPDTRPLAVSAGWNVRGHVPVDGRDLLVEYTYNCDMGAVDPANGPQGMDGNGDGSVDFSSTVESARADKETIVFRVDNRYFSTHSVDVAEGRVVLRSHPQTDYQLIELKVGEQVPDFTYTDFDGGEHRLSDLRARYLLLDFWYATCSPCIAAIPKLKEAREIYQPQGFEILGLTRDEGEEVEQARALVSEKEVGWPQAAGPAARVLINRRFRIDGYPNYVLLDADRRIVSTGEEGELPLRGEHLLKTLEQLFSRVQSGAEELE